MQVLGLFMVVFVFTSTGSASGDQMELHSVSPAALIRDQPHTGAQTAAGPKLLTKDGLIQGLALDKCYVFYGIPFARSSCGGVPLETAPSRHALERGVRRHLSQSSVHAGLHRTHR